MASPNFDALNIRLSRMMDDAVAAATTNGDNYTSAYRDQLLNNACRRLQMQWISAGNDDALRGYINTASITLSSSVYSLASFAGGVLAIKSVYNTTDSVLVLPETNNLKAEVASGNNIYIRSSVSNQRYFLNNANIEISGGTATSSLSVTYVKKHADLAANDAGSAGDLVIPDTYFEEILRQAAQIFYEQNPSKENVVKMQTNG